MKHRPECLSAGVKARRSEAPIYGLLCICDRLEKCEKRGMCAGYSVGYSAAMADGWGQPKNRNAAINAVLDAARGAIEALRGCLGTDDNGDGTVWVEKADALEAIDALREKT